MASVFDRVFKIFKTPNPAEDGIESGKEPVVSYDDTCRPSKDGACYFTSLYTNLVLKIGTFLSAEDISSAELACSDFKKSFNTEPGFWRDLCGRDFNYENYKSWGFPLEECKSFYAVLHRYRDFVGLFTEQTWPHGGFIKIEIGIRCFILYKLRIVRPVDEAARNGLRAQDELDEQDLKDANDSLKPSECAKWQRIFRADAVETRESQNKFDLRISKDQMLIRSNGNELSVIYGQSGKTMTLEKYIPANTPAEVDGVLKSGLYYGNYGPHGWEILEGIIKRITKRENIFRSVHIENTDETGKMFVLKKISGDINVPCGEISHQAYLEDPEYIPSKQDWQVQRFEGEGQVAGHRYTFPMFVGGRLDVYRSGKLEAAWYSLNSKIGVYPLELCNLGILERHL